MTARLALAALLAALWSGACTGEHESAFKSNLPDFDQELKSGLAASNIPFREDAEGFVRYSSKHEAAVQEIKDRILKEMTSGSAWRLDDEATRDYLKGLLGQMGMKYRVQPREDGVWIRWYPRSKEQELEVQMKVAQHIARTRAAGKDK